MSSVSFEQLVTKLTLTPEWKAVADTVADPGRATSAADDVASPSRIALLNLPDLGTGTPGVPAVHVAACQSSAPYRRLPLDILVGGERRTATSAFQEAILGNALTTLPAGQSQVFDLLNTIEVELDDPEHWLESRDDDALLNGANLAALGDELIQYGVAEPIGERKFRLSRLLRGRRATEWAMTLHQSGERFCLLAPAALVAVEVPLSSTGATISVRPDGVADKNHPGASAVVTAEALRPPSPVRLSVTSESGAMVIGWTRRSRQAWGWLDGVDAPLGEREERYRLDVEGSARTLSFDAVEPCVVLTADDLATLGDGEATVAITQVGDFAQSRPLCGTFII